MAKATIALIANIKLILFSFYHRISWRIVCLLSGNWNLKLYQDWADGRLGIMPASLQTVLMTYVTYYSFINSFICLLDCNNEGRSRTKEQLLPWSTSLNCTVPLLQENWREIPLTYHHHHNHHHHHHHHHHYHGNFPCSAVLTEY